MNRFKGLDLLGRVPEELWMYIHNIVQKAVTKIISKKNKCKEEKWSSNEVLQIAEARREVKGQGGRKGMVYPTEYRVPENSKRRREGLLQRTMQRSRGKQQNRKYW